MRVNKFAKVAAVALVGALALAGCNGDGGGNGAAGSDGPFTIGVSNAFVGSEFRTQMVAGIEEVFAEYEAQGLVDRLVVENADADINGQIQQIRNLINQGVDAIIVNPQSATALDGVFQEAISQGILVYAVDQAVESEGVTNVTISQEEIGRTSAEWFAAKVGDGARIVTVEGATGSPARDARWAGAQPIFEAAGIEVIDRGDGGWNQAQGQTVATDLLATNPDIDGIWTYDGMAQGVFRAVDAAGKLDDLVIGGEARGGFMRMWNDVFEDGFDTIGVINPPGVGATALRIAVRELQGQAINPDSLTDGHVVIPLPTPVTRENFLEMWQTVSDKEDTFVMDYVMTSDEVQATFFD